MSDEFSNVDIPKGSRIVRCGGRIYVARHKYFWNKEKQRGDQVREYIGKIEEGKFVPNKIYKAEMKAAPAEKKAPARPIIQVDKSYGATAVLLEAANETGLTEDLVQTYGDETANLLLSLAAFQVSRNSSSLYRFASFRNAFALMPDLPESVISPRLSELLDKLGANTAKLNELFRLRSRRVSEREYLSFDSTKIASVASSLTDVRKGISKRGGYETQIGLALLFGHESGIPVMFRRFAGNIPDIKTISDLLYRWDNLDSGSTVTGVFDRGYCSTANIRQLLSNKRHFVMATKTGLTFVKDAIEQHMDEFWDAEFQVRGEDVTGVRTEVDIPPCVGDGTKKKAWLYLFYSGNKESEARTQFFRDVESFENDWAQGEASAESKMLEFFNVPEDAVPGVTPLERNQAALNKAIRYLGFFAILSDRQMSCDEIIRVYRSRDCVEKCFGHLKTDVGLTTTRGHKDTTVNGRLLLGFIAVTMVSRLIMKMSKPVTIEKKVFDPLLDDMSLMNMLDELEQIRVYSDHKGKSWIGEVLGRHLQILQRLQFEHLVKNSPLYN